MFALALGAGCRRPPRSPERVFRAYFEAMARYALEEDPAVLEDAWKLLDSSTRKALRERAVRIAGVVPTWKDKPWRLLAARTVLGEPHIAKLDIDVEGTSGRATVHATLAAGGDVEAHLVEEPEGWRVSLPPVPE